MLANKELLGVRKKKKPYRISPKQQKGKIVWIRKEINKIENKNTKQRINESKIGYFR